jgi:hypothetical protein
MSIFNIDNAFGIGKIRNCCKYQGKSFQKNEHVQI